MSHVFRKAAVAGVIGCMGTVAHAEVLSFDDLGSGFNWFTANYQGFTFGTNSAATTAWFYTSQISQFYQPKSGTVYVATDFQLYSGGLWEETQAITNTVDFRFDGAWFSGGDQVRYKLFNNGALVHTSDDSAVLSPTPIWVASGYMGFVDSVVVVGRQGFYAMDSFTYAPIPEASSLALFSVGLLTLGVLVRRRAG